MCRVGTFQINLHLIYVAPDVVEAIKSHIPVTLTEVQPVYYFSNDKDNRDQMKEFEKKIQSKHIELANLSWTPLCTECGYSNIYTTENLNIG